MTMEEEYSLMSAGALIRSISAMTVCRNHFMTLDKIVIRKIIAEDRANATPS